MKVNENLFSILPSAHIPNRIGPSLLFQNHIKQYWIKNYNNICFKLTIIK